MSGEKEYLNAEEFEDGMQTYVPDILDLWRLTKSSTQSAGYRNEP